MQTSTLIWPGFELEIDRPGEFVYSDLPAADERWTFVDQEGHGHFWKDKGYPTLTWVVEPCTMGHDDCDGEGHYECSICGEEIRPGTRTADPIWIAGAVSYTLKVMGDGMVRTYALTEREVSALTDAVSSSVEGLLADSHLVEVERTGPPSR